jgi:hypothetical protein
VKAIVSLCAALLLAAVLGPAMVFAVTGPAIHVEKLVNDFANTEATCVPLAAGDTVFYTFYVSGAGTEALANIQVSDEPGGPPAPILGTGLGAAFNVGDRNFNNLLDSGEIWQYAATSTAVSGEHRDLATASGDGSSVTVTDDDPGCYNVPVTAVPTTLAYDGGTSGDFNDAVDLSATLTETNTLAPVVGATLSFTLNATESCDAVTDASGHAACGITPAEPAGVYPIGVSFAGDGTHLASAASADFTVSLEDTALAVTAGAFTANGQPASFSAVLSDPGNGEAGEATSPIAGKSITITLGSGASAQSCAGVTDASGDASCSISSVNQSYGPVSISASFAGDAFDQSASSTTSTTVFGGSERGVFTIGDLSAVAGAAVTWWSPAWSSANQLTGGSATSAFKGFAGQVSGSTWTAASGSSEDPPTEVPTYLAVAVVDQVTKTGSTISGTASGTAIVLVNPGYDPLNGTAGTGLVLGFLP